MASRLHLRFPHFSSHYITEDQGSHGVSSYDPLCGVPFKCCTPSSVNISLRWNPPKTFSSKASAGEDHFTSENEPLMSMPHSNKLEFNRVNCLVWVLHESARSFSLAVQEHELTRSSAKLAKAWIGVDVHAWHKRTAYQVAAYGLFKAAIEVELFLSHKRSSSRSPVFELLSPRTTFLGEFVENQLKARHPRLVQWFRTVELPRIAGLFIPLFKKWSVDYAGSGVAGIILAISCCAAVGKLGSGRIACPSFTVEIEDVLIELMDLSLSIVSLDKLHHLAVEAGFEEDFLVHFGRKVLPTKNIEDVEFWIGLVQNKLCVAFNRENVITGKQAFSDKVQKTTLATLGIFAFLGRETRLFLYKMNIKDLDDQIEDFLSYLECGSLFIYPEFNSLPDYQLFVEVVEDEIGWLDFYSSLRCKFYQDGRRSKQQARQAEKEIILYTVLTTCYDVFSGFAHYSNSAQRPLDANLLDFLLRSQTLLSICLEDYWAAYDKPDESMKFAKRGASNPNPLPVNNKCTSNSSILLEAQQKQVNFAEKGVHQGGFLLSKDASFIETQSLTEGPSGAAPKPMHVQLLRESTVKLISASNDILMGTRLLAIDVLDALGLLMKQLHGHVITKRERKKIKRTLADIANLIPVTILMLIPVSAVGHAAILAAIKKYMPSLIPSPYSFERLNLVKQLKRTKKMEVQVRTNIQDSSIQGGTNKGDGEDSSIIVSNAEEAACCETVKDDLKMEVQS